jgi:hypothetical protein
LAWASPEINETTISARKYFKGTSVFLDFHGIAGKPDMATGPDPGSNDNVA